MSEQSSKQPNFRLAKTILQQSPISTTGNILNTDTNEVWRAKIFDLEKVNSYDMMNVLEYNEEVFHFLNTNYQNSLYLQKCFVKNDKDYLIFQPWQIRLSDYISQSPNGIQDKQEVKSIIHEVLLSICDIYAQDFMVLNLKPQNIVKVSSPNQNQLGWRIESLVFQYQSHNLPEKCEYEFDYDWASNEEKTLKQNLDQNLKDEQIVWYMGILALRLIYGPKFELNKKFKDSDLNLNEIKQKCLSQVFEMIQKSVKANAQDRIPLKSFLQLKVFDRIELSSDLKQKFRSGHEMRIKKSILMKSSVLKKSSIRKNQLMVSLTKKLQLSKTGKLSIPKTKKSMYIGQFSEAKAQKMYNEFRWILEKCFYLAQVKNYTQSAASIDETNVQDKTVIRYVYFKLAEINFSKFLNFLNKSSELRSFRQSQTSKKYYEKLLSSIKQHQNLEGKKPIVEEAIQYEKKMKILDQKKLKLLSDYQSSISNLKKSIEKSTVKEEDLSQIFSLVNGKFFSSMKRFLQKSDPLKIQKRGIKIRAICFFIFSSYLILINPVPKSPQNYLKQLTQIDFELYQKVYLSQQNLSGSVHVKFADDCEFIKLCEYTSLAREQILVKNAQNILIKYFKTSQRQAQNSNEITFNSQSGKRNNFLTVPNNKNKY